MGYGQNDDAQRYEDQRRQEQQRFERQQDDDNRRYYENKQETDRQNQAYADRKKEEYAQSDAVFRQAQEEDDHRHRGAEDAHYQNLKQQQQDHFRAQDSERSEQRRRQQQPSHTVGYRAPEPNDNSAVQLLALGLVGLVVWGAWTGLHKFWLNTQQWQAYDTPQRWVGQFYRALFDMPRNAIGSVVGGNMDFMVRITDSTAWMIGIDIIAVIFALMVLGLLAASKRARWLFSIGALVLLTPALLGGCGFVCPLIVLQMQMQKPG